MTHSLTRSKYNKLAFLLLLLAGIFFLLAAEKTKAADSTKIIKPTKTPPPSTTVSGSTTNLNVPTYLLTSGKCIWNTEKKTGPTGSSFITAGDDNNKTYVLYSIPKICDPGYSPVFFNSVYYSRPMKNGHMMGIFNSLKLFVALDANGSPASYDIWGRIFETDSVDTDNVGISWQIWCARSDRGSVVYYDDSTTIPPATPPITLTPPSPPVYYDPTNYGSGN